MKRLDDFLEIKQKSKEKNPQMHSNNIYAHDKEKIPIQNWYTIVAGFSGDFIRSNLKKLKKDKEVKMLDPFMGTGTSALIGLFNGVKVYGIDANPFTHFVSKVKTNIDINRTNAENLLTSLNTKLRDEITKESNFVWRKVPTIEIKEHLKGIWQNREKRIDKIGKYQVPPIPHIQKWVSPKILLSILELQEIIDNASCIIDDEKTTDLMRLAFASLLLPVSNLTLSGPKIAYRRSDKQRIICEDAPVKRLFLENLTKMVNDIRLFENLDKKLKPELFFGDARKVTEYVKDSVDIILTSPPYLNEVDYLDNSRLELFFLDFVKSDTDIRSLKEIQIRGNTKYLFTTNRDYPENVPSSTAFDEILTISDSIKEKWKNKAWGWDHPRMVVEYFIDMKAHLAEIIKVLKSSCFYKMIIGDSAISGILIPTDEIIGKIAKEIGFSKIIIKPFRYRSSSRHKVKLRESIVTLWK